MDELRAALELATDDELQELTQILFQPKFNPLDYVRMPRPGEVQTYDRSTWLYTLEQRFQFLAADGLTILQGRTESVNYRQVLLKICQQLKIAAAQSLSTLELESEIFLTVLERACKRLPPGEYKSINARLQTLIARSPHALELSAEVRQDPLRLALTGGGALALSSMRPWLLRQVSQQLALHLAQRGAAQQLLAGGGGLMTQIQGRWLLNSASRGIAVNTARYGVLRGALAFLGPALWMLFVADLGWRAISTNYTRVIPVVFTLAQIRLTRT
ncbi:YaaW family protein [Prochlorothrix hollandica]|uniref:Uncharacterized protein n=1 Tax=Prochlorothrix hollandica PCC 9006 = CALU 1027 TaxID=317619 RepID=A0A0M2PP06_PROHO|nr:YaaW family protein [Prochlorothrix hollandica]KKI98320.1 hypothetical protein PROH_19295 [Prochlorothrix hollandica PCC 9006 = CALU 1027]